MLNDQKDFSLKSGTRQGYSFLTLLFNRVLEVLARATRQEKEINDMISQRRRKTLFANDTIFYIENTKEHTNTNYSNL